MSSTESTPERPRLFVYGSLRAGAGHPMHRVLADGGAYMGTGTICGRLYRVSWYPAAVLSPTTGDRVSGDVWELADGARLARLDAYEGCGPDDPTPCEYERRSVTVTLADGPPITTWTYLYAWSISALHRVQTGDWLEYLARS